MHKIKINSLAKVLIPLGVSFFSNTVLAQQCQNPTPVWADEFDGTSLDTSKWEVMTGDGCSYGICGWGNNELQSYQAENNTVSNGILTITAKKQRVKSKNYTSGRIRTANMPNGGQWTNGRFEARIKLPNGTGMWPAFWMLPTDPDVGWPASGEIDIMEATGQADMFAFGTIHYGQAWPDNEWTSGRILKQPDAWSADFHEYAVEWEPNEIRWYIDDILYSVKTPADMSDSAYWTFENYQYHFLLNLAVGGSIGGVVDDSMLPQTMEVDYVRVYDFAQPSLSGEHIVEPNSSVTYQVIDEAGTGSSYSWTSPTGETSSSNSLTVNWGTTSGTVSVAVTNSCGSENLSMDVHVSPELVQETVLDDFDSNRHLSYTSWTGTFEPNTANPAPDAINSSTFVLKHTRDAASQWDVIAADTTAIADVAPFISGNKAFYLDLYTAAPVGTEILVQLENANTATPDNYPTGRHSKYIAHTTAQNTWQRLKFELEDRIDGATADTDVNSVILLIDPNAFSSDTYYLDNFDIYGTNMGGGTGEEVATSVVVSNVTTGTVSAGKGKKYGKVTVTVVDNLGAPAAGYSVAGSFSGTFSESVTGTTDENGKVELLTSASASGSVSVNFCVSDVSGLLVHDSNSSVGICP
ncbi:family 16 glycosylhydrolase [Thalassotalea sp. G2M2-11]|uniref:family 16 glycosylhydrolase n=1 Tax=Thalassotalea sp. G2M2-11 TaxID=2787627 RepID=UPI0019CFF7F8|nr:family 16 glycosylhydrolase [Thalassotalea sp. G2M2-11]